MLCRASVVDAFIKQFKMPGDAVFTGSLYRLTFEGSYCAVEQRYFSVLASPLSVGVFRMVLYSASLSAVSPGA